MRSAWKAWNAPRAGSRLCCKFRTAVSKVGSTLEFRAEGSRLHEFWEQAGFAAGVALLYVFVCLSQSLSLPLRVSLSQDVQGTK